MSRLATGRVRVLLLELPSALLLRMQLEAAIAARGCFVAESPADADALLVVGEAPAAFVEITDSGWNQIPSPRHRVSVIAVYEMAAALDEIPSVLGDRNRQIRNARQWPQRVVENADGMDMDMSGPAGLPLAGGDDSDRDGLEMDVTHLTLGPLLPNWPAWCCTAPCTATSSEKRRLNSCAALKWPNPWLGSCQGRRPDQRNGQPCSATPWDSCSPSRGGKP